MRVFSFSNCRHVARKSIRERVPEVRDRIQPPPPPPSLLLQTWVSPSHEKRPRLCWLHRTSLVSGVASPVRLEASLAMRLYSVLAHFQRPCPHVVGLRRRRITRCRTVAENYRIDYALLVSLSLSFFRFSRFPVSPPVSFRTIDGNSKTHLWN